MNTSGIEKYIIICSDINGIQLSVHEEMRPVLQDQN